MKKDLDTIIIEERKLKTKLSKGNRNRLLTHHVHAFILLIFTFSLPFFYEQIKQTHSMLLDALSILYCIYCIHYIYISIIKPRKTVTIAVTKKELVCKGYPEKNNYYELAAISNLRILEMSEKAHELVFNFGQKQKMVRLLINLNKEDAEKAFAWVEERFEIARMERSKNETTQSHKT